MEVADGSPGSRAGIKTYDLILSVDGEPIATNDDLIRKIAAREPGAAAKLRLLRDGAEHHVLVTLAERPGGAEPRVGPVRPSRHNTRSTAAALGFAVRPLTPDDARRYGIPKTVQGLVVDEVQPMSAAGDVDIGKGYVILEVNRRRVAAAADLDSIVTSARPGDVLALLLFVPETGQRVIRTVRVD
jgi:serine protease Do